MKKVVVIVGPSGCGKTAIVKNICQKYFGYFEKVVTDTSRTPRGGEKDGIDYNFVDVSRFSNGEYLESACYAGNWYGTRKASIENIIAKGKIPVLIMDIQGADSIRKVYGNDAVVIFIDRNLEESADAVDSRKCSPEEKEKRKAQLQSDYEVKTRCDRTVKNNGTLDDAATKVVVCAFS